MYFLASGTDDPSMPGMPWMPGMDDMGGMDHGGGSMTRPMWMPGSPPTLGRLLAWHPQPIPVEVVACLLVAGLYLWGVVRLHRRGEAWPIGRTIAFAASLVSILAVTCTGIGGYGMELLSTHMIQHMVLSMVSPVLLLLGAPITLALRALPTAAGITTTPAPCWYERCTRRSQW